MINDAGNVSAFRNIVCFQVCDKLIQSVAAKRASTKMTPVTRAFIFVKMASDGRKHLQPAPIISKAQVPKPSHGLLFLSRSVLAAHLQIRDRDLQVFSRDMMMCSRWAMWAYVTVL